MPISKKKKKKESVIELKVSPGYKTVEDVDRALELLESIKTRYREQETNALRHGDNHASMKKMWEFLKKRLPSVLG